MKKYSLLLVLLSCFLQTSFAATDSAQKNIKTQSLDSVVAIVNNDVITASELKEQLVTIKKQMQIARTPIPPYKVLRKQVIDHLINVELQLQLADKMGIAVTDTMLTAAVNNIAKRNNMSVASLKKDIESQGISFAHYKKNIRKQIIISQIQKQLVGSTIKISDSDVNALINDHHEKATVNNEYHIKNILIPLPEVPSPEQVNAAQILANNVFKKLKAGANFSEQAVQSSSSHTALEGGDLGWRNLASLPSIFAKPIETLKTGQIYGPIRTGNGFHIIKLVGKRKINSQQSMTEAQAKNIIYGKKMMDAAQTWLQTLRSEAYIKLMK